MEEEGTWGDDGENECGIGKETFIGTHDRIGVNRRENGCKDCGRNKGGHDGPP
jgi:hypothetical protein